MFLNKDLHGFRRVFPIDTYINIYVYYVLLKITGQTFDIGWSHSGIWDLFQFHFSSGYSVDLTQI